MSLLTEVSIGLQHSKPLSVFGRSFVIVVVVGDRVLCNKGWS